MCVCVCVCVCVCFFVINIFFFSTHNTTQHSNITKQTTDTYSTSVNREGRTIKTPKVTPLYNHVYQTKKHVCVYFCDNFHNFHGPLNILLYKYLNMQYVKRKNRASALKKSCIPACVCVCVCVCVCDVRESVYWFLWFTGTKFV